MTNDQAILIGTIIAIPMIFLVKEFSEYLKEKQIIKLFRKEDEMICSKISSYLLDTKYHDAYSDMIQTYITSKKNKK